MVIPALKLLFLFSLVLFKDFLQSFQQNWCQTIERFPKEKSRIPTFCITRRHSLHNNTLFNLNLTIGFKLNN